MNDIKIVSGKGRNAAQRQKAPKVQKPPKPERRKSNSALKAALIIPAVVILCMAAGVVALAFYVDNLDTVFPNVWADGIKLSGLTLGEASDRLNGAGYDNAAATEDASATIVLSDDIRFTIHSHDVRIAGMPINAEEAAVAAFEFGRDGSLFANTRTFLSALFNDTEFRTSGVGADSIDEDYIFYTSSRYAQKFNDTLFDGVFDITEYSITIAKGAGIEPIDELEVFDLAFYTVTQAIEWNEHLIAEFEPTSSEEVEVDFDMLFNRIHVDPVDAHFAPGTFDAVEGTPGITFDLEQAQLMFNSARSGEEIVIPLVILYPEVTAEYLESMLFRDVLGTRTTTAAGAVTSGRTGNIRVSTEFINGTILMPGEVFSFNDVVGPRTTARGFREGGAFMGNELVQAVGGGICQTSSTLYNAALYARMEIVRRRPHSFIVTYLPIGQDAMVYWTGSDFQFRNSSDFPIRIDGSMDGAQVTFSIIGTRTDEYTVRLRSVIVSSAGIPTIYREDEEMAPGTTRVHQGGATGHTAEVFMEIIDAEGNIVEEIRISRDTYAPMPRIVYRGPELEEEEYDPDMLPGQDQHPPDQQPPDQPPDGQPPDQQPPPDNVDPYTPQQPPQPPDDYNPYA